MNTNDVIEGLEVVVNTDEAFFHLADGKYYSGYYGIEVKRVVKGAKAKILHTYDDGTGDVKIIFSDGTRSAINCECIDILEGDANAIN